jgi:hypothetical protein
MESEFLTARQVARLLGYVDGALHDRRTRKRLGLVAYHIGPTRSLRFRRDEVLRMLRPERVRARSAEEHGA